MSRTHLARLSAAALLLTGCWIAFTQTQAPPPKLTTSKVKEDLYMIVGGGGNVAVYVTSEGVILVDDKYDQNHDDIVAQVKTVTDRPIKYILSTHYHADHSGGNAKFLPTAEIISTANARANIVNHTQSNASAGVAGVRVMFTDESAVFLGGKEVRARYFGRGHTNGDAIVYFPDMKAVSMGDLVSGDSPGIDYIGGGSLVELVKTYDKVLATYDFDIVIPGHGAVMNRAGLVAYRDNVVKLTSRAQEFIRQGKSQDELAKFMDKEYGWAPGSTRQVQNVPGMMKELK